MAERRVTTGKTLRRLTADQTGGVALMFGLMLPLLVGMAGAGVDYASLSTQRAKLQAVADAAALAAAREFRLGNASITTLNQAAHSHANGSLAGHDLTATIKPTVDLRNRSVTVEIAGDVPTYVMRFMGADFTRIAAKATAKMVGGAPVCVIGLDPNANFTLELEKSAKLEAPNCAVYSNSKKNNGLIAKNSASIRAAFICSAGGRSSPGPGSFSPTPQIDCPVLPDPLLPRAMPTASGCTETNLVKNGGTLHLSPGTYCGGARFGANAKVSLAPGVYIFKDAPLVVGGGASLTGANVSLHFSGKDAVLRFDAASTISLTAPRSGGMAGILISEDRQGPTGLAHSIMSDDAGTLLGTIYLPRNRLHVGANKPVADKSAYTIVVANQFTLSEGPIMVLNTNYSATDIPVPDGVGNQAGKMTLTK